MTLENTKLQNLVHKQNHHQNQKMKYDQVNNSSMELRKDFLRDIKGKINKLTCMAQTLTEVPTPH